MNHLIDVTGDCPDVRVEVWDGYANLRLQAKQGKECWVCSREGGTSMYVDELRALRKALKQAIKELEGE